MSLQERIQSDLIISLKNKQTFKVSLLRVIIGEFQRVGKDLTDDNVIKILKKMKDNANIINTEESSKEIEIIDIYLPKLLEEKQLETVIIGIITKNNYKNLSDIGKIMKELKEKYNNLFDGKMASIIIKNNL